MHKDALKEITAIIGKDSLLTAKEECMCYSYDATNQKFLPEAVAFPRTTEHIARIMHCVNRHRIPVIPRGAGSGS